MNELEMALLDAFIVDTLEKLGVRQLTLFLAKSKTNQKAEVQTWLLARKAANQNTITNLDAAKTVTQTNLTTENSSIDSLITKL